MCKKIFQKLGAYERSVTHLLRFILRLKIKFKITDLRMKEKKMEVHLFFKRAWNTGM